MRRFTSVFGLALFICIIPMRVFATEVMCVRDVVDQKVASGPRTLIEASEFSHEMTPMADAQLKAVPAKTEKRTNLLTSEKRAVASIADLAGEYVMSFTSALTTVGDGGKSVRISQIEGKDSILIENFWDAGINVKAKVDIASRKISIPNQIVGKSSQYGNFDLAVSVSSGSNIGSPDRSAELKGTINEDGTISLDNWWGVYITSGADADKFFGIYIYTGFERANAKMTTTLYGKTPTEFNVIVTQPANNVVLVKNFNDFGMTVEILLNRDKTGVIESQIARSDPQYMDWYTYGITFDADATGNITLKTRTPQIHLTAATDSRTLSWSNWTTFSGDGTYYSGAFVESKITTSFDLEYPTLSVTDFEGEGTESSPYLIKTVDDLILLSDKVNTVTEFPYTNGFRNYARVFLGKYFRLENSLDMSKVRFEPIGNNWEYHFAGTFDGNGKTLSGLDVKSAGYAGLFGLCDTVSVIKNLNLVDPKVVSTSYYAGTVVGISLGTVENCHVTGASVENSEIAAGGVAGVATVISNCTVKNSTILGTLGYAGGVAGEVDDGGAVNCHAYKTTVQGGGRSEYTPSGGVVGNLYNADASNCSFSGVVDIRLAGNMRAGGCFGTVYRGTVEKSFSVAEVLGYDTKTQLGGVVGAMFGIMKNCHSAGLAQSVGSRTCAGIAGYVGKYADDDNNILQTEISACYTSCIVNAETYMYDKETETRETIGGIEEGTTPVISNIYFDRQMCNLNSVKYGSTTSQLTSASGPAGFSADVWSFVEGYYPRLKGFENDALASLAVSAIHFTEYASVDKVLADATLKGEGVTFGLYRKGDVYNDGHFSKIVNGELVIGNEFGTDTIFILNDLGQRYYMLKISPIPFEGAGTKEAPFMLKSKDDILALDRMTNDTKQYFPDTYFKFANDIDMMGDATFRGICSDADDAHNKFAGHIDGAGFTIHNMVFDNVAWETTPEQAADGWGTPDTEGSMGYKGFIGRLGEEGSLKNLNIAADCVFKFWATSAPFVGYNYGVVDNCRNYADVSGISCWIGGITGQNLMKATVSNCYNEGNVSSGYMSVGGIAGSNNGVIENSMNVGEISCVKLSTFPRNPNFNLAGGIAGGSGGGLFRNCLNVGNVVGSTKVGGISGRFDKSTSGDMNSMFNTINYGSVFCIDKLYTGAIGGQSGTEAPCADNYWDCQVVPLAANGNEDCEGMKGVATEVLLSGQPLENYSVELWDFTAGSYPVLKQFAEEPKVKEARKAIVRFAAGEDASNVKSDASLNTDGFVWTLKQGKYFAIEGSNLKPTGSIESLIVDTLIAKSALFEKRITLGRIPAVPLTGLGTESDPYLLNNVDEWNSLSDYISNCGVSLEGKYVKVVNDIDFTDKEFKLLANDGVTYFQGTLDGNDKTLQGVTFVPDQTYTGALGIIGEKGLIKNLTLEGNVSTAYSYTAGFAGKVYGTIENCVNKINVTSSKSSVSGFVALACTGSKFTGCVNKGSVTGSSNSVAGFVAKSEDGVEYVSCGNEGKIVSKNAPNSIATTSCSAAGFVATCEPCKFVGCYNTGVIEMTNPAKGGGVAGLIGYANAASGDAPYELIECYNTATISGRGIIGGLVALCNSSGNNVMHYIRCYNTGDIISASTSSTSGAPTAGISVFHTPGSVYEECYNTGSIISQYNVYCAGISGYYKGTGTAAKHVVFKKCYNKGDITASGNQGAGIVAYATGYMEIDSCYNEGTVEGGFGIGGIAACLTGSSSMTNCWNSGKIASSLNRVGGLIGYNNSKATITNCFNVGDVSTSLTTQGTSTSTKDPSGYGIGGIAGQGYGVFTNCYNSGSVKGASQVGGLIGVTAKNTTQVVSCYNSGKIVAPTDSCGSIIGVAIENNGRYWTEENVVKDTYYVTDNGKYGMDNVGTGVTVAALASMELQGADWANGDAYTLPVIATLESVECAKVNAAVPVFADGDNANSVTKDFFVGNPDGVVWTSSVPNISFSGNDAKFSDDAFAGEVTLTATCGNSTKIHTIMVNKPSGVDGVDDGRVVIKEVYYNIQGIEIPKPEFDGTAVYIVARTYDDGTTEIVKTIK